MPIQENKDTFVKEMFSGIAHRYDLLNRLLSLRRDVYWRRFAVRELLKTGGGFFLDVATGTGDCAIEILMQGEKRKKVVGVDFTSEMIYAGRKKIERLSYLNSQTHPIKPLRKSITSILKESCHL